MYRSQGLPRPHPAPQDIVTINYTLEWPYLENPSNTTFVGQTQIDICRCPRSDLPAQDHKEPGHIYTRYQCLGPEVRFKSVEEELWVLQTPYGPINMLRPATNEERERRNEVHMNAEPSAYADKSFLFLTGPCPRGRYQAFATLKWLENLPSAARTYISSLSLLIQPYEEDCSLDASDRAHAELAEYIVQHLPNFRKLCLNFWDDEMALRSSASGFKILLQQEDVEIAVGCSWWRGEVKRYSNSSAFLEALDTLTPTRSSQTRVDTTGGVVMLDGTGAPEIQEDEADHQSASAGDDCGKVELGSDNGEAKNGIPQTLNSPQVASPIEQDAGSSDGDWTDAVISPSSPQNEEERDWHLL
ncbi:hypothetical protein BDW02DRAFT_2664 [Decorospora gaudefroyi]|uniref:Uncharacterized protein n=1 Tax=Decorospora gaudefroyi TaxID=184978 RepID=A0A6A5KW40_9PLEO|nr:hypothetical protein BDW02DRAFT_2664 [Decorospora gaudefroyi]